MRAKSLPNGKTKQWTITPNDGQPIAIAVICEQWQNGPETLDTFVQVTTPANRLIAAVTDRMPAILKLKDWPLWLGEVDAPLGNIKELLQTFEDGGAWKMEPQPTKPRPSKAKPKAQPGLF
jgi:putative SOS response-associated peptidase YedK